MRATRLVLPVLLVSATLASADVLTVDPTGSHGFAQIQPAIDAAQDGDLILVRGGTYAGFTIAQRSLSVRADVNAVVEVQGGVVVSGTQPGDVVLLGELRIQGAQAPFGLPAQPGGDALAIVDNAGIVRVEGCELIGGSGAPFVSQQGSPGGAACTVEASLRTALVDCKLGGGGGGGDPFSTSLGGVGGHGLLATGSGVVLYDCVVAGGYGGVADLYVNQIGGPGGVGVEVLDHGVFASNTTIRGGYGGYGWGGGDGGDGLIVTPAAQAQLVDCEVVGGAEGWGEGASFAVPGQAQSGGGPINVLPGSARTLTAPALARAGGSFDVEVGGVPGDEVWVLAAKAPAHVAALNLKGVWLLRRPVLVPMAPMAVIGPSGTAAVTLQTNAFGGVVPAREIVLQVAVRPTGGGPLVIGSAAHVSLVHCASVVPDCNGSGGWDGCDLLAGTSIDCDANSVPDECEVDCNGNGVADACDIAGGTSFDKNSNDVPDECEPQGLVVHVDAAAAPGGDGSFAAPFQTIGEAIAVSIDGYTVRVADGVYSGAQNRNLSFGKRELVLESANGSAACTIDCQNAGNFVFNQQGEGPSSRIQGFRILDGNTGSWGGGIRMYQSDTEIRDVVFESCVASSGGGLDLSYSESIVRDCSFLGCLSQDGGGLSIHEFSSARISDCLFVGNGTFGNSSDGGAIYVSSSSPVLLTNLTLLGNQAVQRGGAVYSEGGSLYLANSLVAGNTADLGSSLYKRNGNLFVSSSTFEGNPAGGPGSIVAFASTLPTYTISLDNCIQWDLPLGQGGLVRTLSSNFDVVVERSDVRGGQASLDLAAGTGLTWGPGNLDLDPLFVDADGADGDPLTFFDNDYRLGAGSPCVDAGDNALVLNDVFDLDGDLVLAEPTPFDLDGAPRFVDDPAVVDTGVGTPPIVDVGCYERP